MGKACVVMGILWMALACSREGIEQQDLKLVPNETPHENLETVDATEQASTAQLRALTAIREPEPPAPVKEPPPDLKNAPKEAIREQVHRYRESVLPEKPPTTRVPIKKRPPTDLLGRRVSQTNDPLRPNQAIKRSLVASKAKTKEEAPTGGRMFAPRLRFEEKPKLKEVFPPGRFFQARLLGKVSISSFSPLVLAEVFDRTGRPVGIALGKAGLSHGLKTRALISFREVRLDSGEVISGSLEAFDQDKGQGLLGRVHRRSLQRVLTGLAEGFLGALSLEVDTGGSFADLFKFNLAQNLFESASRRLNEQDLQRTLTLERGLVFWVMALNNGTVRQTETHPTAAWLTTHARDALQTTLSSEAYSNNRQRELHTALSRLNQKLATLPGGRPSGPP